MAKKVQDVIRTVAQNRKARYEYFIEDSFEVGIVLSGTEVKSLRNNAASIAESYAEEGEGEIYLVNAYIPEYEKGTSFNHSPRRPRKLLMHKRQIKKLLGLIKVKGVTLVPLSIYFNKRNLAKVELAVARGKKQHDKREAIKQADWNRQKARVMKGDV